MPLIAVKTSVKLDKEMSEELLTLLSSIVAKATGKPAQYIMVTIEEISIMMSGKKGDAAFIEVRGIGGLIPKVNQTISKDVCQLLKEKIGVLPDRVYLNFIEIPATHWGWNSSTFG